MNKKHIIKYLSTSALTGVSAMLMGGSAITVGVPVVFSLSDTIVQQDLSTLITVDDLGQFTSTPTSNNVISRVYTVTPTKVRLLSSEVGITVDTTTKTVTIAALSGSRFYTGTKTMIYTMPVAYTLSIAYGTIASFTFDQQGFPTADHILQFLKTRAANPNQIDNGQLKVDVASTGQADQYTATITPQL
jgi:hypothetical protein